MEIRFAMLRLPEQAMNTQTVVFSINLLRQSGLCWIVLCLLNVVSCGSMKTDSEARELNLFVWVAYIPDQTLQEFQEATGIHLNYDTYDSNEQLLEKLQSGVSDYDLVVPSDYMIRIMIKQDLLERIDHDLVPNLKNIHARFMGLSFDPGNEYSVPFLWGTTGIGYNEKKVDDPVDSWSILWNPKYAGRILMLDDMRECFSAVLKWKGFPLNSTDSEQLKIARDLLAEQKPLVKTYNSTNYDDILLSGDVWLAHGWSGNFAQVIRQNSDLKYVIPKEGSAYAIDNFAIPKGARHKEEAYAFINYCLDPKMGARITNLSGYPNCNEAARAYIKPEILNNAVVYPDDQTMSRCELFEDLGPVTRTLDRYWTEIKSR